MDWILSEISFKYDDNNSGKESVTFQLVHFDVIESPIIPGKRYNRIPPSMEKAQDELGSVLWLDAVQLFLPYLCNDLITNLPFKPNRRAVCLGEGTGACGVGLSKMKFFSRVFITDLKPLLQLLDLNANINDPEILLAREIDWTCWQDDEIENSCDVIVGCEVLYGNRFVWPYLMDTIIKCSSNDESVVVYLCITLRNERRDLEDFKREYLSPKFKKIDEISLSKDVSVLKIMNPLL